MHVLVYPIMDTPWTFQEKTFQVLGTTLFCETKARVTKMFPVSTAPSLTPFRTWDKIECHIGVCHHSQIQSDEGKAGPTTTLLARRRGDGIECLQSVLHWILLFVLYRILRAVKGSAFLHVESASKSEQVAQTRMQLRLPAGKPGASQGTSSPHDSVARDRRSNRSRPHSRKPGRP